MISEEADKGLAGYQLGKRSIGWMFLTKENRLSTSRNEVMTLTVSASTIAAAEQNLPAVHSELWQDSLQTFPLAHAALARVANRAKADGAKAIVLPADLIDLETYSLERYSLEIKSFRFSDALWRLATEIHGVTFATRLCHQVAAFTPTSAGMNAYAQFTSPANQVLCQVAGLTDC